MVRFSTLLRNSKSRALIACAAAALFLPTMASAQVHDLGGRRDDRREPAPRYDRGDNYRAADRDRSDPRRDQDNIRHDRDDYRFDRRDDLRVDIGIGQRRDDYATRTERVWVAPVYQTVCDRVWRPAVVQDVVDRVWVEPVYEIRETVTYERGRRVVIRDRCLVTPGHYEDQHRQVVIAEAHWDNVERQELISPGHWEYRTTQVYVPQPSGWNFSFGYGR